MYDPMCVCACVLDVCCAVTLIKWKSRLQMELLFAGAARIPIPSKDVTKLQYHVFSHVIYSRESLCQQSVYVCEFELVPEVKLQPISDVSNCVRSG